MPDAVDARLTNALRDLARPLHESASDCDDIVDLAGRARVVLIGEASHRTPEFYRERALITQCPIEEKDFGAAAIEGDWPDAYRVNMYVRGVSDDAGPVEALSDFASRRAARTDAAVWETGEVWETYPTGL